MNDLEKVQEALKNYKYGLRIYCYNNTQPVLSSSGHSLMLCASLVIDLIDGEVRIVKNRKTTFRYKDLFKYHRFCVKNIYGNVSPASSIHNISYAGNFFENTMTIENKNILKKILNSLGASLLDSI